MPFKVVVGPMASGPYVDSSDPWNDLASAGLRKVIGYEMEAVSVGASAYDLRIPYWVVGKGVMDPATPEKSDSLKNFAAHASSEVVWTLLGEHFQRERKRRATSLAPRSQDGDLAALAGQGQSALPAANLPEHGDDLVGRVRERDDCSNLVAGGARLVTVVGPPGAGKTRLATEVAREFRAQFADRVYLVDLALVSDGDLVFTSIAYSLKIESGDPLIDTLRELFRDTPTLIILDNIDHVTQAAPRVAELMRVAPDLVVLVTSQGPLHLRRERIVEVGALDIEDAERLFHARAAVRIDGEAARSAVTRLCVLLDGLPLAIEMVACHAALLTPQVVSRVGASEGFLRLQNLMLDAGSRQATLESAIRWSFDILEPEQQELFIRLSVFDGGWTSEAAARVADDAPTTWRGADLLRPLLDKRFIVVDDADATEPRFRMLSPLREFGMAMLARRGDLASGLARRHAMYFHELTCNNEQRLNGEDKAAVLGLLALDHANIHAALRYLVGANEVQAAVEMAAALDTYWWSRNYTEGAVQLADVLTLTLPDDASTEFRAAYARACFAAGKLALRQFQLADARSQFAVVQDIGAGLLDSNLRAMGLEREALVDVEEGDYAEARKKLRRALALAEAGGYNHHAADCLDDLGAVAAELGDYPEAADFFERAIARYPTSPDRQAEAWVRIDLAQLSLLRGDVPEAGRHARYAWDVGRTNGDPGLLMWAEHALGLADVARGRFKRARARLIQSLKRSMLLGNRRSTLASPRGSGRARRGKGPDRSEYDTRCCPRLDPGPDRTAASTY